jgi:hypothetical protein
MTTMNSQPEQTNSDPASSRTMRARVATFERSGGIDLACVAIAAVLAVTAEISGTALSDRTWALLVILAGLGRFGVIRFNGTRKTAS